MRRLLRKSLLRWSLALGPLVVVATIIIVLSTFKEKREKNVGQFQIPNYSIEFFEDKSRELTCEKINSLNDSLFQPIPGEGSPNFGFNASNIWLKIQVSSVILPFEKKILEIKNPLLNSVDLYIKKGEDYSLVESTGDATEFHSRSINHRYFQFPLPEINQGSSEYLLKINSGGEQLLAPISVWTPDALADRDHLDHMLRGSYFGIILFVLLFNLFVYTIVRERSTLYYVQYNFFLLLLQLSLGGYAFQYLWPEIPYLANIANPFFASVSIFFLIKFAQHFLDLKNFYPKANRVFQWTAILLLVNSLLSLVWFPTPFFVSVITVNVTALILNVAIIPVSILVYRKNFKPAKFFLIGFILLVFTVFGFVATNAGIIQSEFFADYGLLIGSAAEVVLLSLAIVDRFKQFKDEAFFNLKRINLLQREQNVVLEQKVVERTAEIELQKDEILSSIRYAERIQKNVLPSEDDVRAIFPDSFVLYMPKDIVSGDFYWAGKTSLNGVQGPPHEVVMFAAGDCTGHGVPGAMVSILGCNLLRETVAQFPESDPHHILEMMDEKLVLAISGNDKERSGDGMDLGFWSIQKDTMQLKFAGANNNLSIWRRGVFIQIPGTRRPLGMFDSSRHAKFCTQTVDLEHNDIIYSWTDGLPDQFGGPKGKKLKSSGLFHLLEEKAKSSLQEQKNGIEDFITQWKGSNEQTDDICFAAFRVN